MLTLIIVGAALAFGAWGWGRLVAPPPPDPGPFIQLEDLRRK